VRVLITGGGGQVARALLATAPSGVEVRSPSRVECDITQRPVIERVFRSFRPDIVLNTAGYTAVDAAENNQELAFQVNARGAENVAKAAQAVRCRLIHISTDYVFDGERLTPYPPDAVAHPLNVYGESKLAGEERVSLACSDTLIVRTGWVYSAIGKNFLLSMLDLMRRGTTPRVVSDQRGTPTFALDLAEIVWASTAHTDIKGIYHFANAGDASWYEFACAIRALVVGDEADSHAPIIIPISSAEHNAPAMRPLYSVLDSSALLRVLRRSARSWEVALRHALDEIRRQTQGS